MEREPGKELERARKIQQEPELERKRAPGVPDDAPGDTAEDAAGDIDLEHMALFGCGPAYVTNRNDGSVSVVDLRLIREIARIQVGEAPTTPAVGPDKRFVYVSNSDDNTLSVISTLTNTVVETVDLNAGGFAADFPWGVAVSPDSRFVYVANRGSSNVSVVDARRLAVVAQVPLSAGGFDIDVTPDGDFAYVCLSVVGSMAVVDLSTNLQVKTINVCDAPPYIAIARRKPLAYVSCPIMQGSVRAINTNLAEASMTSITTGGSPGSIAFNPDATLAYVTNLTGQGLFVIDVFRHARVATVPVGNEPRGVAVSDNGLLAVVTNTDDSTVSVVDIRTNTVVGTVQVGSRPWFVDIA